MLLVIDTCFNACSVALHNGAAGVVATGHAVMERGHAEALGPMVEQVLAEAGITPAQLTRIAVTHGPGTFTGLRIGLSYAKGLALALGIPLTGIDSLTATAVPHFGKQGKFAIAQQAGGTGLHYWALFDGATARQLHAPALGHLDEIRAVAETVRVDSGPQADQFAAYVAGLPVTDKAVEPLYLRPPDAKPSVAPSAAKAVVRLAAHEDIAAMATIHTASFTKGWSVDDLAVMLANPGALALVVELAGTLYGFVTAQRVLDEAEINTICVLPNYRRQQFGADLMQGLVSYLQANQTNKLFLEVAADNQAARGLYARFGFQETGLRKHYYASGQDAVTMTREFRA